MMRLGRWMDRRRGAGVGVLAASGALVAAALLVRGEPAAGEPMPVGPAGKPLRVAVVDIREVSDTCRRTRDLRAALEKQREAKVAAVRALREKIQRAREELQLLKKGKPAWRRQQAELMRMEVEAEVLSKLSIKELQAQNLDYTSRVYQSIIDEIGRYAKDHGIDLVLRVGAGEGKARSLEQLYQRMALRSVLYAAPALDITEDIRRAVDRAYQAEKRGGSTE